MISFEMLSKENVNDVLKLEQRCFSDPWTLKMFTTELDNDISVYIVARDEETDCIIGYGGMWLMYDCADITNVAVDERYRREGLGSKILGLLENIAKEKGMCALALEYRKSNTSAEALYKKLGFEQNGLRRNYYKNGEDAVLMIKKLKSSDNL